jgi:hyperosmotically inducible periplasmic protein
MTMLPRPLQFGLAAAAALAALASAGCNNAPADKQVSAGTHLDDAVITTKVKSTLLTDSQARSGDTSVETRKGEVLLSGFVDSQAQADREVQLAKSVEGVQSVQNKLMIKDGKAATAGNQLDDSVITVKVKSALLADDRTRGTEFAVTTNKGVVQLSGFVDSADEQARATSVARNVEGVQSVVNDTSIKK